MRADRDGAQARVFVRRSIRAAIVCAVGVALIVLCASLSCSEAVSEWCSRYVSRPIVWLFGHISSVFPFSLFEIFVAVAVAGALSLLTVAVVYCANGFLRRGLSHLCVLVAVAVSVGAMYTLCTAFNYHRASAPVPMAEKDEYTADEYALAGEMFFDDLTELLSKAEFSDDGELISPYTFDEIAQLLVEEMKRFDDESFGGYYSGYTPRVKPMLASELMSDLWLTGITFAPLGEANVNALAPTHEWVTTCAHELMHAKGVMRESDANLTSYWLLSTSQNDFLRLCGMLEIYYYVIELAPNDNATAARWSQAVDDAGYAGMSSHSAAFWSSHDSFRKVSNFFNDIYLQINGQSGTDSYHESGNSETELQPVVDENGNPVTGEGGSPVIGTVVTEYSQVHRFVAKYYLG